MMIFMLILTVCILTLCMYIYANTCTLEVDRLFCQCARTKRLRYQSGAENVAFHN